MGCCNDNELLIGYDDFDCIAQMATHCQWDVLCQYVFDAQNLDLMALVGNSFLLDIMENKGSEAYKNLLCGGTYTGCNDEQKSHIGLKAILAHFSYADYIYRHGMVDMPYSVVQKQHRDSIPVPITELEKLKREYKRRGEQYWERTHDYLCKNKESFPLFDDCNCTGCCDNAGECGNCGDKCPDGSLNIGGYTSTIIKRT